MVSEEKYHNFEILVNIITKISYLWFFFTIIVAEMLQKEFLCDIKYIFVQSK